MSMTAATSAPLTRANEPMSAMTGTDVMKDTHVQSLCPARSSPRWMMFENRAIASRAGVHSRSSRMAIPVPGSVCRCRHTRRSVSQTANASGSAQATKSSSVHDLRQV